MSASRSRYVFILTGELPGGRRDRSVRPYETPGSSRCESHHGWCKIPRGSSRCESHHRWCKIPRASTARGPRADAVSSTAPPSRTRTCETARRCRLDLARSSLTAGHMNSQQTVANANPKQLRWSRSRGLSEW